MMKVNVRQNLKPKVLLDSAFPGQGLPMISQEELIDKIGNFPDVGVVWLAAGEIQVGTIADFLACPKDESWRRLDSAKVGSGYNGYCTGSVTMDVARELGVGFVATAGIGGVDWNGKVCSDIPALADYPGLLVATAPKDILDLRATVAAWRKYKVPVYGWRTDRADGFLFSLGQEILDGVYKNEARGLLLCPIKHELRLRDQNILEACRKIGLETPAEQSPHPLVNAYLAEVTDGLASRLQLDALLNNITIALQLERRCNHGNDAYSTC
jgi:pseudouridine-5'-phosphate glycosidase